MANFANSTILALRQRLEKSFMACHAEADKATRTLRINRVHAGQILIELKEGFNHGDWTPYLSKLCEQAHIPARTARQYMEDAQIASKIPQAILDEAAKQGFNIKARHIRDDLISLLLSHPETACQPNLVVQLALGVFVSPAKKAADKAASEAFHTRCAEFEKFRETHPDPNDAGYAKYKEFASDFPDPAEDAYAAREQTQQARRKQQEDFALQIIDAGYKKLAVTHHPDHGGKTEDFQLLTEARNLLKVSITDTNISMFSVRRAGAAD